MNTTYQIQIESDHQEADQFIAWLEVHGHEADFGDANSVDGIRTSTDAEASRVLNGLWDDYCA